MSLPEFSTRYPVTVTMATLAVILLGVISLDGLGTDLLPDLQTPVVTVDLQAPGKSPAEMEERYTRSLERVISTVRQVKRVYSITRAGQAVVVAEFSWDADMDFGLLDIQKSTGSFATDQEVSVLDVTRDDPQALPVMRIAIASNQGEELDALLGILETTIKPKLEALDGVASAEIEGGAEKEIWVVMDPYLLEAYGLTSNIVTSRIQSANTDASGGTLRENQQSYLVKALGRLENIEDIRELIVDERRGSVSTNGTASEQVRVPVRVKDVADVRLEYQERETTVRLNGVECIGVAIYKEAGSNTVMVVNTVLEGLEGLEQDLPSVHFLVVQNQARFVERAISEVKESAMYGAVLAIFVLMLFLRNWTVTLVIGLAIPISVLATFSLMYFENLTLNVMTLGGLALGAGMLVDNAIVVIENIYRHLEQGENAVEASAKGASEVGVAIMASTLTTVSVFLPIVYVQGLVGELFKEQAWTVAFSLLSSLVIAMTTVPMLTSKLLKKYKTQKASTDRGRRFGRFLEASLNHKTIVFGVTIGLLGGAFYLAQGIQAEFIPREDQGTFQVELALSEGTRLEVTDRVANRAAAMIHEIGSGDVEHVYVRSGLDPSKVSG
ncbi:MAG: efflux RND transporter permease subunit, partial [bacterium]|nr:efflux RND transporter permease subunit [bacterium]